MGGGTLKKESLGNCKILAPDGQLLSRVAKHRIEWYIKRNLAEEIPNQDFPTIRLKIEPKGRNGSEDLYNIEDKENICVVCGCKDNLSKHHIVPYCYRKHFPNEYKRHSSYDVVLLCRADHDKYENFAKLKKIEIAKEYNLSFHQKKAVPDKIESLAIKSAFSILKHSELMPKERILALKENISKYLLKESGDIDTKDIESLCKKEPKKDVPHGNGLKVVEFLKKEEDGFYNFSVIWRQHFIKYAEPKFLSKNWNVNKRIV